MKTSVYGVVCKGYCLEVAQGHITSSATAPSCACMIVGRANIGLFGPRNSVLSNLRILFRSLGKSLGEQKRLPQRNYEGTRLAVRVVCGGRELQESSFVRSM